MSERKHRVKTESIPVPVLDNYDDNDVKNGTLWLMSGGLPIMGIPQKINDVVDRQIKIRGNVTFRFKALGYDWKYEAVEVGNELSRSN